MSTRENYYLVRVYKSLNSLYKNNLSVSLITEYGHQKMLLLLFYSIKIISVQGVQTFIPESSGIASIKNKYARYETWSNEQTSQLIGTAFSWNDASVSFINIVKKPLITF